MNLQDYEIQVKNKKCKFCQGNLGGIEYYEHDGGYEVEGFTKKQWLYKTCMMCDHQWSLVHLGVNRA